MKLILFIYLSTIIFAHGNEPKGKLLLSDTAVFRIDTKVVFNSELKIYLEQLDVLRCFKQKSLLLEAMGLDKKSLPKLPRFNKGNADELAVEADLLKKLVKLFKAQSYANRQKVTIGKDFVKHLGAKKCVKGNWDQWHNELKSLVQAELFFRDRFKRDDSSQKEIAKYKESMQLFLESIHKKVEHDFFF